MRGSGVSLAAVPDPPLFAILTATDPFDGVGSVVRVGPAGEWALFLLVSCGPPGDQPACSFFDRYPSVLDTLQNLPDLLLTEVFQGATVV